MNVLREAAIRAAKLVLKAPQVFAISGEATYYPDMKRKSRLKRVADGFVWIVKYGEVNTFYNLYGQDVEDPDRKDEYMDYRTFMRERDLENYKRKAHPQTVILRDKYIFYLYMSRLGIPVPQVFAVKKGSGLFDGTMAGITDADLKDRKDYFVKEMDGECASFVKHIHDHQDYLAHKKEFEQLDVIFQERVDQCAEMNRLNPAAVNTMRMVTIRTQNGVEVFASEIRVGTSKTGSVDNAAAGGVLIGIRPDGTLRKYGFIKPGHGETLRITKHPDTGVVFEEFKLTEYEKAAELCIRAHNTMYDVRSIGWDVAFSDHGPVLIEGNDNWEITGLQACNGGLRKKWTECHKK